MVGHGLPYGFLHIVLAQMRNMRLVAVDAPLMAAEMGKKNWDQHTGKPLLKFSALFSLKATLMKQ